MKSAVVLIKVFEAANAAALEIAYEIWRKDQGENTFVDSKLDHDGTNIIFTVLYTL